MPRRQKRVRGETMFFQGFWLHRTKLARLERLVKKLNKQPGRRAHKTTVLEAALDEYLEKYEKAES